MNNGERSKLDTDIALFRYEQIIPVLNNTYPDHSVLQYYKRIASTPFEYPDGTSREFSYQTLKSWQSTYKREGFEGLYPKKRSDCGHSCKLTSSVKKKIIDLKTKNPRMTATSIYLKLIEDGDIMKKDISLSTVTRFVSSKPELNQLPVEDMRAFEMAHANDLWQLDTTYCSYIRYNGKKKRTYLIMIIDDHSRMIVGYGFFLEDNAVNVQTVLKSAITKYGIPKRLYMDNGTPYKNEQLPIICAQLKIQINHAQAYHGNQKGKIERAFKSVKEQWMYNTDFSQFRSTDEINDAFAEYVNQKNNTPHSSLKDHQTPVNVFMDDPVPIRRVEPAILEKAFYHTVTRKVANDATIHLKTRIYETGQQYIGSRVTLKYLPDLSKVFIYGCDDNSYMEIHEVNKVENSKTKRKKPLFAQEDDEQ